MLSKEMWNLARRPCTLSLTEMEGVCLETEGDGETDRQTDRQTDRDGETERERSLNHYPAKRFLLLMRMRFRLTEVSQSTVVKPMMMMMS